LLSIHSWQVLLIKNKIVAAGLKGTWSHSVVNNMLIFLLLLIRKRMSHYFVTWMLSHFKFVFLLQSFKIVRMVKSLIIKILFIHNAIFNLRSKEKQICIPFILVEFKLLWSFVIDVFRSISTYFCSLFTKVCSWLSLSNSCFVLISLRSHKAGRFSRNFLCFLFFFCKFLF